MSATLARPQSSESSHWYSVDGSPVYEVPRADGKGMRKTTLADARKLNLVPSVTSVLRMLDKPALTAWLIENACLAVLTTPRGLTEGLDAFVERVLHSEKVQDQESQKARDRGTEIHRAIEDLFQGKPISAEIDPWVRPAFEEVSKMGELVCTEKPCANHEYGGKIDLVQWVALDGTWIITDFKSTKKLPNKSWSEMLLQLSTYANLWRAYSDCDIVTQNVFISTQERGKFVVHRNPDWIPDYENGFKPLLKVWQHLNNFHPQNSPEEKPSAREIGNTA